MNANSAKEISAVETISAYGPARSTITGTPLSAEELDNIDAYWRASLYLCVGMLYLKDNPLLRDRLASIAVGFLYAHHLLQQRERTGRVS